MTEDMRERFEKWHVDKFGYVPIWNESRQQYAGRSREMAEIWQAALSSAGTSGTADDTCLICGARRGDSVRAHADFEIDMPHPFVRRDSLSGKGEATKKCPNCGGEIVSTVHGFYCPKPMCKWGWETEMDGSPLQPPSAPDRAEELAQDKFAELRSFLTNMRRDAADAEDPELSEYAQAIEQRLDELASLLREGMGRWIPVSERLPDTNEAGVSSVFFWVTSEDGWQFGYYRKDAEGECWESERSDAYNEPYTYSTEQVSYWLPESALPAPPREEG